MTDTDTMRTAQIEAVARKLYFHEANKATEVASVSDTEDAWQRHLRFYQSEGYDPVGFFPVFGMAAAALTALEPWGLDALLDSVHPRTVMNRMYSLRAGGWEVRVTVPDGPDENGWYDYTSNEFIGTGPTREAALRAAVAAAMRQETE